MSEFLILRQEPFELGVAVRLLLGEPVGRLTDARRLGGLLGRQPLGRLAVQLLLLEIGLLLDLGLALLALDTLGFDLRGLPRALAVTHRLGLRLARLDL